MKLDESDNDESEDRWWDSENSDANPKSSNEKERGGEMVLSGSNQRIPIRWQCGGEMVEEEIRR